MKAKILKIVGIVLLFGFVAQTWAWMLGAFALDPETAETVPTNFVQWMNPGIMTIPALASIIVAFLALYLAVTLFKKSGE